MDEVAFASAPATVPRRNHPRARGLGTNLAGVHDWTSEEPFVDAHKMARPFLSGTHQNWSDGRALSVDPHGWVQRLQPGQIARSLVFTGTGTYRPGRYVVRYDGEGQIHFAGRSQVRDSESSDSRTVLDVLPPQSRDDAAITMDLHSTNASDPIRNVRIYPPGGACDLDRDRFCDADTPCPEGACLSFEEHGDELVFHPDFLASIEHYGMLRFMDFMGTNNSSIVRWSDRPRIEDATWTSRGIPAEIMIRLANQTGAQPWFCIPHQADDEYVRSFAALIRETLSPDLKVWVEYSNELWNGIFEQHGYAQERGEALGLGRGYQALLHFQARRSVEIFRIFEEVLGRDRIVRVIAAQASNPWVAEVLLDFERTAESTDALAIAPYLAVVPGPDEREEIAAMTPDQMFRRIEERLLPQARDWTRRHVELARSRGVGQVVAYEAGQHLVGVRGVEEDPRVNSLFDSVNRDPRMRDVYSRYLEDWRELGGGWINHFVNCEAWSKWGRWGALEHVRQPRREAPKYDALLRFVEQHPQGW